jgi:hypothetical protein
MIENITSVMAAANGTVFYTGVLEDGQNFRGSVLPGQSLTGLPQQVANFCGDAWTPEVIAAYRQSINQTQEA